MTTFALRRIGEANNYNLRNRHNIS